MTLKGKTAIITGGTKGIGLAIAESMLAEGMNVLITGTSDNSVQNAKDSIDSSYLDKLLAVKADVRSEEDMNNCTKMALDAWGTVDVLIANAGIGHFAPIDEMSSQQWNDTIDINLTGVFNSVKACVEPLKQSGGYIITIASLAGTNFFARGAAYNASKFGLVGFTQAIMLDLRDYDVKCTTIMPGSVSTYFNNNIPSDKDAWKIQPEDIAQLTIDLLKMPARTLPSKVEMRPSKPPKK